MHSTRLPVDRGWAWIIMTAAFFVHLFTLGFIKTSGILFNEIRSTFQSTSSMTAVILGVESATYSLSTFIVVNVLMKYLNIRTIGIVGALLQSLGLALSSCAPNVGFLVLTLGILYGCGQAFLYCPTLVILNQYFNKKRPLATSIACCGVSAGGVMYSYLTRFLIDAYGFHGGLLLLSGVVLQQCVLSALYRSPNSYAAATVTSQSEQMEMLLATEDYDKAKVTDQQNDTRDETNPMFNDQRTNEGSVSNNNKEHLTSLKKRMLPDKRTHLHIQTEDDIQIRNIEEVGNCGQVTNSANEFMYQEASPRFNGTNDDDRQEKETKQQRNNIKSTEKSILGKKSKLRCKIPEIFKSSKFWIVGVFFTCGGISSVLNSIFLPPLMEEKGMGKDDISLGLLVSAICEGLGRILPGLILQCGFLSPMTILIGPMLTCALMFHMTVLFQDFVLVLCLAGAWGFLTGFFWSMQTLILIDVFGPDLLGQALGFYINFAGLGIGGSFPLAGVLKDAFGTYEASYHYLGVMYWLAAISLISVYCLTRARTENAKEGIVPKMNEKEEQTS